MTAIHKPLGTFLAGHAQTRRARHHDRYCQTVCPVCCEDVCEWPVPCRSIAANLSLPDAKRVEPFGLFTPDSSNSPNATPMSPRRQHVVALRYAVACAARLLVSVISARLGVCCAGIA